MVRQVVTPTKGNAKGKINAKGKDKDKTKDRGNAKGKDRVKAKIVGHKAVEQAKIVGQEAADQVRIVGQEVGVMIEEAIDQILEEDNQINLRKFLKRRLKKKSRQQWRASKVEVRKSARKYAVIIESVSASVKK